MWGLNLKHNETISYDTKNKPLLLHKIDSVLKQNGFREINVSSHLITGIESTPFIYYFFGGLSSRTYYTISLTDDGDLTVECSLTKGPGTDWGYCKKKTLKLIELINP